jgi:hypothetical protein
MDAVKAALLDYVIEVFKEVCDSGKVATYYSDDRWDTEPYLLWASDAAHAAQDMVRLIAKDVKTLKGATRTKRKAGAGRRSRSR